MKDSNIDLDHSSRLCRSAFLIFVPFILLFSAFMLHAYGGIYYPGDVNEDKTLDISDAVLLARLCAEDASAAVNEQGLINADANNDHCIDSEDCVCILKIIAHLLPMPESYCVTDITTTITEQTVTQDTESTVSTTESTAVSTSATSSVPETDISTSSVAVLSAGTTNGTLALPAESDLIINDQPYPLGVSISVLTGKKQPKETLTVHYECGNVIFAIYADDPAETTVAIAYEDKIVGYFKICNAYTAPAGYKVREYIDRTQNPDGELYAITILREDFSITFDNHASNEDLVVFSKLNYYALNGVRAINGVPALIWYSELTSLAQKHSADMAKYNYFDHPDPDGTPAKYRFLNAGIDYMIYGENIDTKQYDPFEALDGWYASSGHRSNMLSTQFTHVGIGFAFNPDPNADQCFYGTQDFCVFFP